MIDSTGFSFGSDGARLAAAVLFLQSSMEAMDVYSALNSSPWTAESFGADPAKRAACLEYVYHGVGVTAFYCIGAAVLSKNWWPIIGGGITAGYMFWLYKRALSRAQASGSTAWGDEGGKGKGGNAAPQPAPTPVQMNGNQGDYFAY